MPEKRAYRDEESQGDEERGCQCCQVTGHRHLLRDCGVRGGDQAAGRRPAANGAWSAAFRIRDCLLTSASDAGPSASCGGRKLARSLSAERS